MKRPTIADIAARAGVTKAAVSFALNGQPGVSAATRERILAIAAEIGFQPSSAARALTGGKAETLGLVLSRPARTLSIEPFFMQLISGIQDELSGPRQLNLLFTLAADTDAEIAMYRRWWAQGQVDGVFVVDLQVADRRIPVLEDIRLPAVVIGGPGGSGTLPAVGQDDRAGMEAVIAHLAGLGHRHIARVGGHGRYWHSRLRAEAFATVTAQTGLTAQSAEVDYTTEHGVQVTTELLGSGRPPTAILYDNDILATAGLGAAQRLGISVPRDLSIVSWEDSVLCELTNPDLTALRRDVAGIGAAAARTLRQLAAGGQPGNVPRASPALQVRASSGRSLVSRSL